MKLKGTIKVAVALLLCVALLSSLGFSSVRLMAAPDYSWDSDGNGGYILTINSCTGVELYDIIHNNAYRTQITTIYINCPITLDDNTIMGGSTGHGLFSDCQSLTSIVGLGNLNTATCTTMASMFTGCVSLVTVDLSGLETDSLNNVNDMFSDCKKLEHIYADNPGAWNVLNEALAENAHLWWAMNRLVEARVQMSPEFTDENGNSYQIKYVANDGNNDIKSRNVKQGSALETAGALGFTASGNKIFGGWNTSANGTEITLIPGATSVESISGGTIKFYNGQSISSASLVDGTYTFNLYAVWGYNVTWDVEGATTTKFYKLGDMPSFDGSTDKAADAQYTYTFTGWSPEVKAVTESVTYTAQYSTTTNQYTIKFVDEDGTELSSTKYDYGTAASQITVPADPTREASNEFTYTFAGWSPTIAEVTGNATYTATYTSVTRQYTITFKYMDADGNWKTESSPVNYGVMPTPPDGATAARQTVAVTYTFTDWDSALASVTGDKTYEAKYEEAPTKYTVTFKDSDGAVLSTTSYDYGTAADDVSKPADPTKAADAQYTYEFKEWTPAITAVTGDATYTATYKETLNTYTITFKNYNDETLDTQTLDYGATPKYIGSTPVRAADNYFTYTFAGWTPEITAVTENKTYTASYESHARTYTITFNTNGGSEVASITGGYETPVTAPANPTREGYTFDGWDPTIPATITANITISAKWTADVYTIEYNLNGGEASNLTSYTIESEDITLATPTREGYTFVGWTGSNGETAQLTVTIEKGSTGDKSYTATWKVNQYTITFDTDGGTEIAAITADYGAEITAPDDPTKVGYTFGGWDTEIPTTMPAEDLTIKVNSWDEKIYTVQLMPNGGVYEGGDSKTINDVKYTDTIESAGFTKDYYVIRGWSLTQDGTSDDSLKDILTAEPDTDTVTLYAIWGGRQVKVTVPTAIIVDKVTDDGAYTTSNYEIKNEGDVAVSVQTVQAKTGEGWTLKTQDEVVGAVDQPWVAMSIKVGDETITDTEIHTLNTPIAEGNALGLEYKFWIPKQTAAIESDIFTVEIVIGTPNTEDGGLDQETFTRTETSGDGKVTIEYTPKTSAQE